MTLRFTDYYNPVFHQLNDFIAFIFIEMVDGLIKMLWIITYILLYLDAKMDVKKKV